MNNNASIKNIYFKYDKEIILNNVSMDIKSNEKTFLVGLNGVGKTTLLNVLLGIDEANSGTISFDTNNLYPCFSNDYFPKYASFLDIIKYYKVDMKDVLKYIECFSFDTYINVIYKNLSTGNKQKFKIIITLLLNKKYLIFDEPTNGLDIDAISKFINIMKNDLRTTLIITHDMHFLDSLADNVYFLNKFGIIKIKKTENWSSEIIKNVK